MVVEVQPVAILLAEFDASYVIVNLQKPDLNFAVFDLVVLFGVGQLPLLLVDFRFQVFVLQLFNDMI
jgi:hypothetical protein